MNPYLLDQKNAIQRSDNEFAMLSNLFDNTRPRHRRRHQQSNRTERNSDFNGQQSFSDDNKKKPLKIKSLTDVLYDFDLELEIKDESGTDILFNIRNTYCPYLSHAQLHLFGDEINEGVNSYERFVRRPENNQHVPTLEHSRRTQYNSESMPLYRQPRTSYRQTNRLFLDSYDDMPQRQRSQPSSIISSRTYNPVPQYALDTFFGAVSIFDSSNDYTQPISFRFSDSGSLSGVGAIFQNFLNQNITTPLTKDSFDKLERKKYKDLKTSSSESKEDSCTICMSEYSNEDDVIITPCKHNFHPECLKCWIEEHHSCPVCRSSLGDFDRKDGDMKIITPPLQNNRMNIDRSESSTRYLRSRDREATVGPSSFDFPLRWNQASASLEQGPRDSEATVGSQGIRGPALVAGSRASASLERGPRDSEATAGSLGIRGPALVVGSQASVSLERGPRDSEATVGSQGNRASALLERGPVNFEIFDRDRILSRSELKAAESKPNNPTDRNHSLVEQKVLTRRESDQKSLSDRQSRLQNDLTSLTERVSRIIDEHKHSQNIEYQDVPRSTKQSAITEPPHVHIDSNDLENKYQTQVLPQNPSRSMYSSNNSSLRSNSGVTQQQPSSRRNNSNLIDRHPYNNYPIIISNNSGNSKSLTGSSNSSNGSSNSSSSNSSSSNSSRGSNSSSNSNSSNSSSSNSRSSNSSSNSNSSNSSSSNSRSSNSSSNSNSSNSSSSNSRSSNSSSNSNSSNSSSDRLPSRRQKTYVYTIKDLESDDNDEI
jgi:hypothetical protein